MSKVPSIRFTLKSSSLGFARNLDGDGGALYFGVEGETWDDLKQALKKGNSSWNWTIFPAISEARWLIPSYRVREGNQVTVVVTGLVISKWSHSMWNVIKTWLWVHKRKRNEESNGKTGETSRSNFWPLFMSWTKLIKRAVREKSSIPKWFALVY